MTKLFWQFHCGRLSSFNREKLYYSYAWSCSLREEGTSFYTRLISRKTLRILTYVFDCLYITQCLTSFSSIDHLFLSLCTVFDSFSYNIDEVLSTSPSANMFIFSDFNIQHKDWRTYSGETDIPDELCYDFSNDLKWPYSDAWLSYLDPWLWISQSCSSGFLSFF